MDYPSTEILLREKKGATLHVTFNRPKRRNAMNLKMVEQIIETFAAVQSDASIRAVVLRGSGGHFCAGGDLTDMAGASMPEGEDPVAASNRLFGTMLLAIESSRVAVVALCEGAVMGGGFGIACVSDVTIAVEGARFRMPETTLGILPAQIAPFVVRRLGLSQGRRLAVTGEKLSAKEAYRLHLAHHLADTIDEANTQLSAVLKAISLCEPLALAETKSLVRQTQSVDLGPVLDGAAKTFSRLAQSEAAQAGFGAFLSKEASPWAKEQL